MGLRRLTLFAMAHGAGTVLLAGAAPRLLAEVMSGEPGAALLLIVGAAAVVMGMRTALSVILTHIWRACAAAGLTAAPVRVAALRIAPRAVQSAVAAAVGGTLTVAVLAGPSLAAAPSPAWPLSPEPVAEDAQTKTGDGAQHPQHDPGATGSSPAWPLSDDPTAHPSSSPPSSSPPTASPPPSSPPTSPSPTTTPLPPESPSPDVAESGSEHKGGEETVGEANGESGDGDSRQASGRTSGDARSDGSADDSSRIHVVVPGDTLWEIVSSELPGAGASDIAVKVKDLHTANRSTVGDDANLILPGQRLVLP